MEHCVEIVLGFGERFPLCSSLALRVISADLSLLGIDMLAMYVHIRFSFKSVFVSFSIFLVVRLDVLNVLFVQPPIKFKLTTGVVYVEALFRGQTLPFFCGAFKVLWWRGKLGHQADYFNRHIVLIYDG